MTSPILRSAVAALAFAGALAFATPSMAAMINYKATPVGHQRGAAQRQQGHRHRDRDL